MNRFLKWLLLAFGALVLLLVALAVLAALLIDPNAYRAQLAALVEQQTGRELRIEGDMSLTFFPWLGLEIGRLELGNAPGFGPEPFAALDRAVVRVAVWPLLRGEVQVGTVVLHGLQANLGRNADGRSNWEDLTGPEAAPTPPEPAPDTRRLAALAIGGLDVRDARVQWDDRLAGQRITLSDLRLESGAIAPGEAFSVQLSTRFANTEPALDGQLELAAELTVDPAAQVYRITGLQTRTVLRGAPLPSDGLEIDLGATSLVADLSADTAALDGLRLSTAGLVLEGQATARGLSAEPSVEGRLSSEPFAPRQLMSRFGVEPPQSADPAALGSAQLQTSFAASTTAASLREFELRVDDSRLNGAAGISDFAAPAIRFELALDDIDLDRYLPPPAEGPSADRERPAPDRPGPGLAPPGAAAGTAATGLPVDALRELQLDGSLTVDKLKGFGLRLAQIHATATARDGQLRLHPLGARLYEGEYAGDLRLNVAEETPQLAMNETLSGVQIGPLLEDLQGEAMITGHTELSARLTARGPDPQTVRKTLAGEARFAFHDGSVKGINIAQLIREAYARVRGQSGAQDAAPRQTDFASITGSVQIADGRAENRDLDARSPLLRVTGRGTADLLAEQIDYTADVTLVQTLEGQGGEGLEALRGLSIPVRIKGPFTAPKFRVELERILREKAKGLLEEQEAELRQRLKQEQEERGKDVEQKLQQELQDRLKGLFGR